MAYKHCLELFSSNCAKRFVLDVKREDVLAFMRKLYNLGCGPRTAYNRAVIVSQLLKNNGITKLLSNRGFQDHQYNEISPNDECLHDGPCSDLRQTVDNDYAC